VEPRKEEEEEEDEFTPLGNSSLWRQLLKHLIHGVWDVTPCNGVVGYQRFGEPCRLHLQGEDIVALFHT